MYNLYVITDDKLSLGKSHVEIAALAYEGGADIVQLRAKDADGRQMLEWAKEIRKIADKNGKLFIVNDRLDIAILSNADGAHLGQSDVPVAEARRLVSHDFIIGASVRSVEDAEKALMDGADYVALTIFDTKSKADALPGHGLELLREIHHAVDVPVIGIGGITKENAASVIKAGADGIAVISAVVSQTDVRKAAKDLREIVTASKVRP